MKPITQILWTVLLAASASACADWSDPADFDAEVAALQKEWKNMCGDACSGDPVPAACGFSGDAQGCAAYNLANATACIDLYEKVIRHETCSATDEDMIHLGKVCNAVYLDCGGATDTGETDTDTGTDTGTGSAP